MNKLTHKEFLAKLTAKRGKEFKILSQYIDTKTKLNVKHSCGYVYDVTPNHLLSNKKCPNCGGGGIRNKTTDIFKNEVKNLTDDSYTVLGEYRGVKDKILLNHNDCGYQFEMRPGDFLSGQRCPKCSRKNAIKKTTKSTKDFEEDVRIIGKGEYELVSEYTNNKNYVTIKHIDCGNEYEVSPVNFLKGHGCPKCAFNTSTGEEGLLSFIRSVYNKKIITNEKSILSNKKEIDIYLPEDNIAFEYNGLYWHSEEMGKTKNYHIDKTNELNKKGIRLIHVFEDEWLFKNELTKSKILHILNLNKGKKIYARKCSIKEINNDLKNEFLEKYHIQGSDISSIRLGLFYEKELAAVITFSKLRSALGNKGGDLEYELVRYASNTSYILVGGFGKLLDHFKNNYQYKKIKTYADLRWSSDTNIYNKIGFVLKHRSDPNYWYFKPSELIRYHRYTFRKDNIKKNYPDIFDSLKTENEMMKELKYNKIWDCGNLVYELEKE